MLQVVSASDLRKDDYLVLGAFEYEMVDVSTHLANSVWVELRGGLDRSFKHGEPVVVRRCA
ncbi:hypothetical protein [Actinokineospora globicatena]|uniref:Uncharacterized protein n=1 Tax=Actinokineospora globicatena TaxID=103729 RepID=A0A9W6V9I8_9PSEU|nr:hypothetical protein [Actinokineospora globicatena]GLW91023.1 hypothetical protein Aglo03_18390 [Actinokineospora globicatena]